MRKSDLTIFCDFDGTISSLDVSDVLLEKLADPKWLEIEAAWLRGEIGSGECMRKQFRLIRGGWKACEKVAQAVQIDPTFRSFASWCRESGIKLFVVSEGADQVIYSILHREGIVVDGIWANELHETENGNIRLKKPCFNSVKGCKSGVCKCSVLKRVGGKSFRVVIGDGMSDHCWADKADLLFAKSKLLKVCREEGISCLPFESFTEIRATIEKLLLNMATEPKTESETALIN